MPDGYDPPGVTLSELSVVYITTHLMYVISCMA